ncbi:MAG: radical SAM protein [Deltaproteobacteria bacterium]|nr:radical SAM protein [Deltaproteobacteria bacterium]
MNAAVDKLKVIRIYGDPEVAEVGVMRFRNDERFTVETVDGLTPPLSREQKWVINLSTQFGCPVGCPFCDAALDYAGNPSVDELLAQVKWALKRHPGLASVCKKLKVHFARMGEPALNDAVLEAMQRLPQVVRSDGLWCCVATVAPRGRDKWFESLYEIKERYFRGCFQLQFSVQSTSEADRTRLIPMSHWNLEQLATYGRHFFKSGDRKVVLNFALAKDVAFETAVIEDVFDPDNFAVKLTPVNPTAAGKLSGFKTILRSERDIRLKDACQRLGAANFDVVVSVGDEREDQIGSNCGQAVRVERGLGLEAASIN